MPNRIIKESIRTSDTLSGVTAEAERLFWRIVVSADDFGRFDARPAIVLGQCLSAFIGRISVEQVREWLIELMKFNLITVYKVQGRPYLQLTKWVNHQTVRAKKSKFPEPIPSEINCKQMLANVPVFENGNVFENENGIKHSYASEDDVGEQSDQIHLSIEVQSTSDGAHHNDGRVRKRAAEKSEYTDEFKLFWSKYPRTNTGKQSAFAKWTTCLKNNRATADELIQAAENYAEYCRLMGYDLKHTKLAETFLGPSQHFQDFVAGVPAEAYEQSKRKKIDNVQALDDYARMAAMMTNDPDGNFVDIQATFIGVSSSSDKAGDD